jgi:hypothetical protein
MPRFELGAKRRLGASVVAVARRKSNNKSTGLRKINDLFT